MLSQIKQLDRILRGEATRPEALRSGTFDISSRGLLPLLAALGAVYGACMGLFAILLRGGGAWKQVLASAVKVPALFLLTLLVTLPSLYVFNALIGSRLTFLSMLRLMVAALGVMLTVLASFATITAFFTVSTSSYPFILLLNVAIFTIAGVLGLAFLLRTLQRLSILDDSTRAAEFAERADMERDQAEPPALPSAIDPLPGRVPGTQVRTVFRVWVIVFALVGAQMAWVLRPFVGRPGLAFEWFRARQSNFFEAVFRTLKELFGA